MAEVAFEDVTKVYADGTKAVDDLDLAVQDGEFMVLVGPSGCGKTTALRMLAGLEEITGGAVLIDDRVVNHVPSRDRDIAMVFQSYALYPHLTVYENIAFGLRVRKIPKQEIDQRVHAAAAATLGIETLLQRKPRALSGGQRQRVAMGRAIVRQPAVYLMDEPLSNLDAKLRVQMRAEISRLQKELGVTTIYVTHDQVEAMTMGDRVAVMRKGELQQVATPQELYDRPVQPVRGRLHRQPGDEPARRRGRPRWADRLDGLSLGSQRLRARRQAAPKTRARRLCRAAGSSSASGRRASRTPQSSTAAARSSSCTARIELREALGSETSSCTWRIDGDAPAHTDADPRAGARHRRRARRARRRGGRQAPRSSWPGSTAVPR